MISRERYWLYFLAALLLHVGVAFAVVYKTKSQSASAGLTDRSIMTVYVTQGALSGREPTVQTRPRDRVPGAVNINDANVSQAEPGTSINNDSLSLPNSAVQSQQAGLSVLLARLHDAIAKEQMYPASALANQQSGLVSLSFCLSEEGELSQLQVGASSGVASLDRAAIRAAQAASPVREVIGLVDHPQCFTIAVKFMLQSTT